tara:strand:- start:4458 stop:5048 length:591 start_codon:yes stop_codon:yes gene_type:complete
MKVDVLNSLREILSEGNWEEEKGKMQDFIANAKKGGYHAENKLVEDESSKSVEEDEENFVEEETEEELEEETEEEKESLQNLIKLENAQDFEKLKDILNKFRASRSLSDSDVSSELQKYHDKLTRQEKEALFIFISGLVQITQQDVDGKAANSPEDMMYGISKKGELSSDKKKSMRLKQKSKIAARNDNNTPVIPI